MTRSQCENCIYCVEEYPNQRVLGSRSMRQCTKHNKTKNGLHRCIAKIKNCKLKEEL